MKTDRVYEHQMTPGATFETQVNDPTNLGTLKWTGCTVLPGAPTPTDKDDVWMVRLADGRQVRRAARDLRHKA